MHNQKGFTYISIAIITLILAVGAGYYYLDKTPSLTITSPKHGESLEIGKIYDITWKSKNIDKVSFYLARQGQNDIALTMGQNTQASLEKYSWTIPTDNKNIDMGGQFQICVFADNNYLPITCSDWFSINKKLANWKNYTNSKYNYRISYPEDVYTIENITYDPKKETTDDNVTLYDINSVQETKECECGEYIAIHIDVYSNSRGLSLENYIKENIKNWAPDYSSLFINEQTSLNGIPVIKIGTEREQYYILEKNNVIFSIGGFIDMNIISTFKFINE
ncbi:MAG: Ser-Thr-rich GPI-anchored membrane family protein [Bacilli bacterium]